MYVEIRLFVQFHSKQCSKSIPGWIDVKYYNGLV